MKHGTIAMVLATMVAQAAAGCSSDSGSSKHREDGGAGGDQAGSAGTTDDRGGGASGEAGGVGDPGTAGSAGSAGASASGGLAGSAGAGVTAGSSGLAEPTGGSAGGDTTGAYDPEECPPCERGCAVGDPHLITFDGAYYDFQSAGEYTLVSAGELQVQARLQATQACEDVAYVRAVAFGSADHNISVHADAERFVRLGDGSSFELGHAETQFGDWQLVDACDGVIATSDAGDQVIVHYVAENWLDVEVRPADREAQFGGLFGNRDGDETNEIALPDGTLLPDPVPWEGLYSAFGGSWMVLEETSLFVYDDGEGAADYSASTMPGALDLSTVPDDELVAASTVCGGVTDSTLFQGCLTDVICGGADPESAAAWFNTNPEPKQVLDISPPSRIETCFVQGGMVMDLEDNTVDCPAACADLGVAVWGTDIYTDDSSVCTAAIHAGLIDNAEGGIVVVHAAPGQTEYVGSTSHGVTTLPYGEWAGSFTLSLPE